MPILINEIEISITVVNEPQHGEQTAGSILSKEEIIKECVEIVVEMLNQKHER